MRNSAETLLLGPQLCTRLDLSTSYDWPFKSALSMCSSTWREIRNAFPVISLGDQNKDIGAACWTLLTRVRLRTVTQAKSGLLFITRNNSPLTFLINCRMSNKLRRRNRSSEKSGTLFEGQRDVQYYPTAIKENCRVLSTNLVQNIVTPQMSLHTLLGKHLSANQCRPLG